MEFGPTVVPVYFSAAFLCASLAISRKAVLECLKLVQLPCMTSWDRDTRISWHLVHFLQEKRN